MRKSFPTRAFGNLCDRRQTPTDRDSSARDRVPVRGSPQTFCSLGGTYQIERTDLASFGTILKDQTNSQLSADELDCSIDDAYRNKLY